VNVTAATLDTKPLDRFLWRKDVPICADGSVSARKRDVYLVILDQYASIDEFRAVFGVDNTPFVKWLESRGFLVAGRATTRFNHTGPSVADLLNGVTRPVRQEHWQPRDPREVLNTAVAEVFSPMPDCVAIRENRTLARFTGLGYHTVNLGSWFPCTRYNALADENINVYAGEFREELSAIVYQSTVARLMYVRDPEGLRRGILREFDALTRKNSTGAPTFTFAHIICPHSPYVFDRFGAPPTATEYKDLYVGQYQFITEQVKKLVARLQSAQAEQPVIIIQSDHGSNTDTRYFNRVFSAVFVPDSRPSGWRDNIPASELLDWLFSSFFGCASAHL